MLRSPDAVLAAVLTDVALADVLVAMCGDRRRSLDAVVAELGPVAEGDLTLELYGQPITRGVSPLFFAALRAAVRDGRLRLDCDVAARRPGRVDRVWLVTARSHRWHRIPCANLRRAAALF